MRFTSMRFDGLASASFKLIGAKATDPYVIKNVEGLGPTEVDVTTVTPVRANAYHVNSFANSRQIVVTLTINPDFRSGKTVDQLREDLYWMVEDDAARGILITFVNGDQDLCNVRGYVSRMPASIFSKNTDLQISFECLGSKFSGVSTVTVASNNGVLAIVAEGTARTFPSVTMEIIKPTYSFAIRRMFNNRLPEEEYLVLAGFLYNSGDRLEIGSVDGMRTVRYWRNSDRTLHDHIKYLQMNSRWPNLDPRGVNVLTAWGSDYMQDDVRITSVQYRPMYRGV